MTHCPCSCNYLHVRKDFIMQCMQVIVHVYMKKVPLLVIALPLHTVE